MLQYIEMGPPLEMVPLLEAVPPLEVGPPFEVAAGAGIGQASWVQVEAELGRGQGL